MILDLRFLILDFWFLILDFWFWILDFRFWILDFGFWIQFQQKPAIQDCSLLIKNSQNLIVWFWEIWISYVAISSKTPNIFIILPHLFQFLYSVIKRSLFCPVNFTLLIFQFLYGAIKSPVITGYDYQVTNFNSFMVRLKAYVFYKI